MQKCSGSLILVSGRSLLQYPDKIANVLKLQTVDLVLHGYLHGSELKVIVFSRLPAPCRQGLFVSQSFVLFHSFEIKSD